MLHADVLAQAETNAMTFGLLGPVGLIAVVLGVLGMTAGVMRQRRKTRATAQIPVQEYDPPSESATADTPRAPFEEPAYSRLGE